MPTQHNGGFSFMGMVVGVMTLLKLKDKYDQYKQTSSEDEEGRVALHSPSVDNLNGGGIALLDTEIPASMRRTKKKPGCCICCGMDCTLFWKAVGIVLFGWTLFLGFKAFRWALTDAPTGLEDMPAFGTSLGCADASHLYNGTELTLSIPIANHSASSSFETRGGSVGTILIADGAHDATEIKYTLTLRTTKEALLEKVGFVYPDINSEGTVTRSRLIVDTPYLTAADAGECMRYDVTVFFPPTLKKMHVQARTLAHVSFAEGATAAGVEQLSVTLYALDAHNIVVPSKSVVAKMQQYDLFRGYVVGEASIAEELSIETQRGDAVANVKITPAPPADPEHPEAAILRTVGGGGRSDFVYLGSTAFTRHIQATHSASKNADMYLTYRGANVNGKVKLHSKSYTMTGAQSLTGTPGPDGEIGEWTHFVGDQNGGDEIRVDSRGWTGLYF